MAKFLRRRSTKKYWRMFRNTMGKVYRKVYRKLSNKGYPMNVYILKSGVKGRKKFYKVLKYLFKR